MSEFHVWVYKRTGEFLLSTKSRWSKKPFSLYVDDEYWSGPVAVAKHDFLFLGPLDPPYDRWSPVGKKCLTCFDTGVIKDILKNETTVCGSCKETK